MNQDNKFSSTGIIIWVICAVFFMYEFLLRTVVGTFQHPIMSDLEITSFKFAILSSTAYLMVYGVMQVPVGVIADKFGLKRSLLVGVLCCAISIVGFAMTYNYKTAIMFRILMGFGSSFGFICLLVAVYDWLPNKYSGLFIGCSQFIGTMGPMFAAGPLDSITNSSGISWRSIFLVLAVIGGVISVLVFLIVRNNNEKTGAFIILRRPGSIMLDLKKLFSQSQAWLIALYSASTYFAIEYLSESEGKVFLMLNGYSANFASYMITVAWLGYALGCPLIGFLSDYLQRRRLLMIVASSICIISITIIIYFPLSSQMVMITFFSLGLGASGQSIGFAIMAEQCGKNYLAAGLGLNNAMITAIASVNAPLIGFTLDHIAGGSEPILLDYHYAFIYLIAFSAIALILSLFFIKETFCKSSVEPTILNKNSLQ